MYVSAGVMRINFVCNMRWKLHVIPLDRRLYSSTPVLRGFSRILTGHLYYLSKMFSEKHMIFYYENIFFKKSKIGHGGPTQNRIMRRTTVTEFSKTFLVFYKWLNLTDVQVIVRSKVCLVIFVCCEHAPLYFYHFLVLQVDSILRILNLAILFVLQGPTE